MMINAYEKRDTAVGDVSGAFLKGINDRFVIMRFYDDMIDIMLEAKPELIIGLTTDERGKRVLVVVLAKALYGCVRSSFLWHDLFSNVLKKMGFELNPVEPCVANAILNGKQCTIAWYVDDSMTSHDDPKVVDMVLEEIERHFGKMTITRGKEHEFLGIKIKFLDNGTAELDMSSYLRNAIDASGLDITKHAMTAAKKDLRSIDEGSPRLSAKEAEQFVTSTYMLMHVALRARGDLCPTLSFLSSRVAAPTKQDQQKLKRLLEFVLRTINDKSYLGADDLTKFAMYVDVAFAVHADRKSHTGGVISFGTGGLMISSTKQRLVAKSSTEGELVGSGDYMPCGIWMKRFMDGQGHFIKEFDFLQDNEATMNIEENGRASASTRLRRHVDIQYFFIKDKIESNGITMRYCNTAMMLADYLTKPLQGRLFHFFRAVLLGHKHLSSLQELLPPGDKRVGENDKKSSHGRNSGPRGGPRMERERQRWEESRVKIHPAIKLPLTSRYKIAMSDRTPRDPHSIENRP